MAMVIQCGLSIIDDNSTNTKESVMEFVNERVGKALCDFLATNRGKKFSVVYDCADINAQYQGEMPTYAHGAHYVVESMDGTDIKIDG